MRTLKRFFSAVYPVMFLEVMFKFKRLATLITMEFSLTVFMFFYLGWIDESLHGANTAPLQ